MAENPAAVKILVSTPNPLTIVGEIGKSANLDSATSPGWPQDPRWPWGLAIGCLRARSSNEPTKYLLSSKLLIILSNVFLC